MQVRNSSPNTQLSYLRQVPPSARHFGKSPDLLGREDIQTYQIYLANEKKLAYGSIHIAISALRFSSLCPSKGLGTGRGSAVSQEAVETADHP